MSSNAKFRALVKSPRCGPHASQTGKRAAGKRASLVGALVLTALAVAGCESDSGPDRSAEQAPVSRPADQAVIGAMVEQGQRARVLKVQRRLARLGYEPGRLDGVAGDKTRSAIRQYQADRGLPRDGRVTQQLLSHLAESIADRPYQPETWLPSRLPEADYEPGDSFIYSNGRIDTVTAVRGDRVFWRSNQGTDFETYKNFVLPRLSWRAPGERGRRFVQAGPGLLWPLLLGEERSFTSVRMVEFGGRPESRIDTTESWRCGAEGRTRVSLVAGTFDTVRIACERAATESRPRYKRIWYYAPRLRHYVRVVDLDETNDAGHQVDLIAMQPTGLGWPPIVRTGLRKTLEQALRTLPNGESAVWESTAIGMEMTIRPGGRALESDGVRCRTLWQDVARAGGLRSYPGLACRETEGRWQVLGFQDSGPLLNALARGRALQSRPR